MTRALPSPNNGNACRKPRGWKARYDGARSRTHARREKEDVPMRRDVARVRLHATRNNVPYLDSGRRDTECTADTCRRRPTVPPPRGRTPLLVHVVRTPNPTTTVQIKRNNFLQVINLQFFCNLSRLLMLLIVKDISRINNSFVHDCSTGIVFKTPNFNCFSHLVFFLT